MPTWKMISIPTCKGREMTAALFNSMLWQKAYAASVSKSCAVVYQDAAMGKMTQPMQQDIQQIMLRRSQKSRDMCDDKDRRGDREDVLTGTSMSGDALLPQISPGICGGFASVRKGTHALR